MLNGTSVNYAPKPKHMLGVGIAAQSLHKVLSILIEKVPSAPRE